MNTIYIYDTTLRDGTQGIDITYTADDKLAILKALDDMRIDYVEGGFPFSNEKDRSFFEQCKSLRLKHTKLVAFGNTRKAHTIAKEDAQLQVLLSCNTPAITLVGKTSKAHVIHVLKTSQKENLNMIEDSISFLKKKKKEVIFDAEHFFDGYKESPEYAIQVLHSAARAGADSVVLCDTNGGTLPDEVGKILANLPLEDMPLIGGHFHDDCGTAVANSLLTLRMGARQIQGTFNGWGERCGNANLCTLLPNLFLKTQFTAASSKHLKKITAVSRFIAERANIIPDKRHPYVGDAAFTHKAGLHADVVIKSSSLIEHIDSKEVGNERHIVLSELAGKSTILAKLKKYGTFMKNSPEVEHIIQQLKEQEMHGFTYEAAEASFDLLIRKTLNRYQSMVHLRNYHLELFKSRNFSSKTVGRIFLDVHDMQVMGVASGTGMVEALDKTLKDALVSFYPFIKQLHITDYRVRIIDPENATAAIVRVFITSTDGTHYWNTIGVHQNIIEASWQALVDSLEYYYNNFTSEHKEKSVHSRQSISG